MYARVEHNTKHTIFNDIKTDVHNHVYIHVHVVHVHVHYVP